MRRFLLVPAACLLLGAPAAHAGSRAGRRARGQYKRVHIRAMKQLLAGQAKPAEQWCHTDLEERGDDPETLFCLTLAQAQLGQLDKATATVKKAVGAGLPLGRFLAGPREPSTAIPHGTPSCVFMYSIILASASFPPRELPPRMGIKLYLSNILVRMLPRLLWLTIETTP